MKYIKPDREGKSDVMRLFKNPPPGYGIVPFYWWVGDRLTKERLLYQLDALKGGSITGLQINYCHDLSGGVSFGLPYQSDPPLFTDEWWGLFSWFVRECKSRNISVSLSDYSIGFPGQGYYMDEILKEYPDMTLSYLTSCFYKCEKDERFVRMIEKDAINVSLISGKTCIFLNNEISENILDFCAPENGRVCVIRKVTDSVSYNPFHKMSGERVCEKFFGKFADRLKAEDFDALDFFFSDELKFAGRIPTAFFTDELRDEFIKLKGYDIVPYLAALFENTGKNPAKVRLDYYDVFVRLISKNYLSKIYNWFETTNKVYGCDHGSRGVDTMDFGDYFRTVKYYQGPGCDQPFFGNSVVKNKVNTSISHMYKRQRVWLEGFWGTGWGTNSTQLTHAIRNLSR